MYNYFLKHTICAILALTLGISLIAQNPLGLRTVVIDPGHGGHDPGAVSKDQKTYEKTLTLDISKRRAARIQEGCPDVQVILTRTNDTFIELINRAAKANNADANLFISIHINSADNTSANGYSVHVLGKSEKKDRDLFALNMEMVKRENSVILLEDDYSTTYQGFDPGNPESYIFMQLMQNANLGQSLRFADIIAEKMKGGPIRNNRGISQDPFLVLWRTSMPAVLCELGFVSNSTDLTQLRNADQRDEIARRLFLAFQEYKQEYDHSVSRGLPDPDPAPEQAGDSAQPAQASQDSPKPQTQQEQQAPPAAAVRYGTQIFAGAKLLKENDPAFLGYKVSVVHAGSLYRYVIGVSTSEQEARALFPKIKEKYKDAFFVEIDPANSSTRRR